MNCVKCSSPMKTFEVEGIEIDQCPKCSGIWCDPGEYEKLLKIKNSEKLLDRSKKVEEHNDKVGFCPRCGGQKYMVQVSSVNPRIKIDKCVKCNGLWLDGGEFEVLQIDEVMSTIENLF